MNILQLGEAVGKIASLELGFTLDWHLCFFVWFACYSHRVHASAVGLVDSKVRPVFCSLYHVSAGLRWGKGSCPGFWVWVWVAALWRGAAHRSRRCASLLLGKNARCKWIISPVQCVALEPRFPSQESRSLFWSQCHLFSQQLFPPLLNWRRKRIGSCWPLQIWGRWVRTLAVRAGPGLGGEPWVVSPVPLNLPLVLKLLYYSMPLSLFACC